MAVLSVFSAGLMCLNACSSSDGVVGAKSAHDSVVQADPKANTLRVGRVGLGAPNLKAAVNDAGPQNHTTAIVSLNQPGRTSLSNITFNSGFNIAPEAASKIDVANRLDGIGPVENYRLSQFAPIQKVVGDLQIARKIDQSPVVESVFAGEISFNSDFNNNGQSINIGVAPRFSVWQENAFEGIKLGGELRIGQDFDQRGRGNAPTGWYVFVGTDGEALTLGGDNKGKLALMDQLTVGDLQTGLLIGGKMGQFIIGFTKRTISYSDQNMSISHEEDISGVSFVKKF